MRSDTPYRFSVIVPLGSERGQTEDCLRAWIRDQTFPRDRYEVLVVGHPPSLRAGQVATLRALLAPPDRLLEHDQPHDLALSVQGAREAGGELLFFTESHVVPHQETLRRADEAIRARPEMAGLSGRSHAVTHNRLSSVEADMYESDIRYGMEQHPWRKILDQCYVAWREPYFEAGGFRPEFGHFAEWLLAARMYRLGYRLGYAPEIELWHHYLGHAGKLVEFAADFAHGEMRYHGEAGDDPCRSLFDEIPEWVGRHRWRPELARAVWSLSFREWRRTRGGLRFLLAAAGRAGLGIWPDVTRARLVLWTARAALCWRLWSAADDATRRATLVRVNDAAVRLARLRFVQGWLASGPSRPPAPDPPAASPWEPTRAEAFRSLGFHPLEHWNGRPFRWSEPVAMLDLPLTRGDHEVSIHWLPVRPVEDLRVYVNGAARPVTLGTDRGVARFHHPASGRARLAWACVPWRAPRDPRFLGLPVHRISWSS